MAKYILVVLILFSISSPAQIRTKILIIDTLAGQTESFKINGDSGSWEPMVLDLNKFPNLNVIIHTDNNSELKLSLDDSGGYLVFDSAFLSLTDIIRISKLTIYHNCFPDTTFFSMGWYKKFPSDTSGRLKHLRSKESSTVVDNGCHTLYSAFLSLTINSKVYRLPLERFSPSSEVAIYHGYHNKRNGRRAEQASTLGRQYKYFVASIIKKKYILRATVTAH